MTTKDNKPSLWVRTKEVASTYTGTFILVMLLNQIVFFGFCLNPVCIIAAMPHVLLITVAVGTFFNKIGGWGEKRLFSRAAKDLGEKSSEFGEYLDEKLTDLEAASKEANEAHRKKTKERLDELLKELDLENDFTSNNNGADKYSNSPKNHSKAKTSSNFQNKSPKEINAYITNNNFNKILKNFDTSSVPKSDFKLLYKSDLSEILSHKELALLCIYKEVCQKKDNIFDVYRCLPKEKANRNYVFKTGTPSYHLDQKCDLLLGDFYNLKVPYEVQAKGDKEITRFKKFCEDHRREIEAEDPRVYMRMEAQFFLKNRPEKIVAKNSGATDIKNIELPALEERIDKLLVDADIFKYSRREHTNRIDQMGYADVSIGMKMPDSDPLHTWHQTYKLPLIQLMREYFRIKFNKELSFSGSLLEQLGFSPCSKCIK